MTTSAFPQTLHYEGIEYRRTPDGLYRQDNGQVLSTFIALNLINRAKKK